MRRHWRRTTVALAGAALIASAVASSTYATTPPESSGPASSAAVGTAPAGTEPAATEPAGTEPAGTEPAGTAPAATEPQGPHRQAPHRPAAPRRATCSSPTTRARRAERRRTPATSPSSRQPTPHVRPHAVQPRSGDPGQGRVLLAGDRPERVPGEHRRVGQRADRHRSVHAQRVGARQPDRARGQPRLLGRAGGHADRGVPVEPGGRPTTRAAPVGRGDGIDNVGTDDMASDRGGREPAARPPRSAERLLRRLQRRHGAVQRPGGARGRSRSASTASG